MSTITKESIADTIEGLEHLSNSGIQSVYIDMAIAGMRRLLASLEAEPVAYMYKDNLHSDARFSLHTRFGNWSQEDINEYEITEIPLYAAPPAPVALPVQQWEELCRQNPDMSIGDAIIRAAWWNHCAAMLKGADGKPPVIQDGWVLVPIEPTYQMCEAMGLPWESPRFPDRYKAMIAAAPKTEHK